MTYDFAIIGGGIVGLATALALPQSASIVLFEKEREFAAHQRSGRAIQVCNAPSPAATASIEIGKHIASSVLR